MKSAELIIDSTEKNIDLYYAVKFTAPDRFTYLKIGKKKYLIINDLEIDRAKKSAKVDHIISQSLYIAKAAKKMKNPSALDAVRVFLDEKKIKKLIVPDSMPFTLVDYFRKHKFKVAAGSAPFYSERLQKTAEEKRFITQSQKNVYSAMKLAEDMIRKSKIVKNKLYLNGKPLTSERVRDAVELHLFEKNMIVTDGTIVSCGMDSIDPHCTGSGPLRPHTSIIVDIFPKSTKTLYYGDATRTFCKGKAPAKLKKMYDVVKKAQEDAIKQIRAGVDGKKIHEDIVNFFDKQGYPTGKKDGRMQGFFHGTGHSIGLELHEEPLRIRPTSHKMKEGYVMSVEPGLYYKDIGGVRIEDLVYITKTGCEVLSRYPKKLEIL